MRTTVALVRTRPETIGEDYRRLLELARVRPAAPGQPWAAVVEARSSRFAGGNGSPPWQLDGVLGAVGEAASEALILPCGTGAGDTGVGAAWGWSRIVREYGATEASAAQRTPVPVRPGAPLDQLATVLPDGFAIPAGVQGRRPLLLAGASLGRGWPVRGAVALLAALLQVPDRPRARVAVRDVRSQLLQLAREFLPPSGAVLDGVLWRLPASRGSGPVLMRNVLIAGRDPVAVDAVATRLAGTNPAAVPWLRACQEHGVGTAAVADIRLAGDTEIEDLDFGVLENTFARSRRFDAGRWRGLPTMGGRDGDDGPWQQLARDYVG